jgi:TusA-related sulfurtransferase
MKSKTISTEMPGIQNEDPIRDELLEFHTEATQIGSTCAVLTPAIRSKLREMQTGQVLEVRVDDPSAKSDVEAWSRLSGNELLKVIDTEGPTLRFFVKKK